MPTAVERAADIALLSMSSTALRNISTDAHQPALPAVQHLPDVFERTDGGFAVVPAVQHVPDAAEGHLPAVQHAPDWLLL
jgi:hypothetical protein